MFRYLNNGISIAGIPERDLTVDEFNLFEAWLQKIVKSSGAYEFVENIEAKEPVKGKEAKRPKE